MKLEESGLLAISFLFASKFIWDESGYYEIELIFNLCNLYNFINNDSKSSIYLIINIYQ